MEPQAHPQLDDAWRETVRLRDGTLATLRLVRPDDREQIARGFERLSPEARYRRFFAVKTALSPAELDYLTHVDGQDHVALCAVHIHRDGRELGLGLARMVRLADDPQVAEAAIVVMDDQQNKGLGRILLARLQEAAQQRGIQAFRCTVLADNPPAMALLREFAPLGSLPIEGGTATLDVPLAGLSRAIRTAEPGYVERLLGLCARGLLVLKEGRWLQG